MASPSTAKDVTSVLIAAIGTLFHTHPNREVLKAAWEPILGAIAIDSVQNCDTKESSDAKLALAQMLLDILNGDSRASKSTAP